MPDALEPYRSQAEDELRKGAVKDIEFSGSTYQVLVEDSRLLQKIWVFIQLDVNGAIQDSFCSDEHDAERIACLHQAIAYLSLFGESAEPLHQRFTKSIWNRLCRLFEERLGGGSHVLEKLTPGVFTHQSPSGKTLFMLEPKSDEAKLFVDKTIRNRRHETEETSLKFSNLSHEELSFWREGRPTPQLRYDLSFWSDLAKWLMKRQEEGAACQITFKYSKRNLPNWFQFEFADCRVGFYVSEANLPLVIEALQTVDSPLSVNYAECREIERISYDKKDRILRIEEKKSDSKDRQEKKKGTKKKDGIEIKGWTFIPNEGFYAKESHDLLKTPILHGEDIAQILSEHKELISSLIVGCKVHLESVFPSYHLRFDRNWNLNIEAYLFEPGDLVEGDSWLMGSWAYLDDDGFYFLEENRFHDASIAVPFYQVSEFISQNRSWFNAQEGYQTHVRSIEFQMDYQMSANGRLTFTRSVAKAKKGMRQQDFGAWVYLEGLGFYPKTSGSLGFFLKPGIALQFEQIPLFIRMNRDELALIPHFFSEKCPVIEAGLKIELKGNTQVLVSPEYRLLPNHEGQAIQLFDEFVYMKGEGFHELPKDLRLPEKFRRQIEFEGEELQLFLTYEIEALFPFAAWVDPRLVKLKNWNMAADLVEPAAEKGKGWYRLRLFFQTEKGRMAAASLKPYLDQKFPFAFLEMGCVDLKGREFDWLRQLPKERINGDLIDLTALELIRLNAFDPITMVDGKIEEKAGKKDEKASEIIKSSVILKDLMHLHPAETPDMQGLSCTLRPYQELGIQWLWFLYRQELSGLLCDDMGLGKTHQAMALLSGISNLFLELAGGALCHFLIVCPTSVIYHWQEKLHQYLPGLRVCTFYGTKRSLEDFHQHYDILLTSYGILRNESSMLSAISFEAAVFDEVQIAKNQFSRVHAALIAIKARMKVGLTGTPIENRLRELKSLFDIALPGYLPGEKEFRDFFIKPIEKEENIRRKEILSRLINPFVLRRKKEDVLKDLPEKTEEIAYCDLTPGQQELYAEVLQRKRRPLLEELQDGKTTIPYLHVFALLSSLKQICDHPAVYMKEVSDYRKYHSGKWELFWSFCEKPGKAGRRSSYFPSI